MREKQVSADEVDLKVKSAALIEAWVPQAVRNLTAYQVAHADGLIKLDAMENPYAWPAELKEKWLARVAGAAPNRYPDPQPAELKRLLRAVMEIPPEADLMLGNGSDELIQLVILGIGAPGATILAPDPSFAMYRINSTVLGRNFVGVPLEPVDFSLRMDAMLRAIEQHRPAVTFLAYPNNPTGNLFKRADIEEILDLTPGIVVIDEAYAPFAKRTFMPELAHYPNLLVMRTVSKFGLAGLRLGVLSAAPPWIAELEKLRLPYNINELSQVSAEVALENYPLFEAQTEQMLRDRDELYRELARINHLQVWRSEANFVLVRAAKGQGPALVEGLKAAGVLVRNFHGASPLLEDCIRISVGTPGENQTLLRALTSLASSI